MSAANDAGVELQVPPAGDIKTDFEYAEWYGDIGKELLDATYEEYQCCLDELEVSRSHLDSVLNDTATTLDLLFSLTRSFKTVETQTSAFRHQCDSLLSAQTRNTKLTDDIHENLQYYDFLEPISKRLNTPGTGHLVRSRDFSPMLERLDRCLDYMQNHPEQRDSETYRARYRLLMTRALTLVRGHFVSALRDISAEVSKRIADRQLNDTTMSALLYAKFRVGSSELKDIGQEIQKRVVLPEDAAQDAVGEYDSLMNELHYNFSTARGRLVMPLIQKKLYDIAQAPSTSTDLVAFARASISYMRGICLDEFELWGEWFEGQIGVYEFLESICEPLYDHLRPRILRETKLIKLCQLCTLLQTRYLPDPEEDESLDPNQLDFSLLIQPALEDAQTRLVFRTQVILRDEIERFKPHPEDINYPASSRRPQGSKGPFPEQDTSFPAIVDQDDLDVETKDAQWDFGSRSQMEGWYPTLTTAVWLLSRIYRLLNSTVFDDLAHQIVHQTTLSLVYASTLIPSSPNRSVANHSDASLFLIKHLLILKHQILAFDLEYSSPDSRPADVFLSLDTTALATTFQELRTRGSAVLFDPKNLMRLVGAGLLPRVVENMLDARTELDARLRTAVNDYTRTWAEEMVKFPSKTEQNAVSRNGSVSASYQHALHDSCRQIESSIADLRRQLDDYITDRRTKETLVAAVREVVCQVYEDILTDILAAAPPSVGVPSSRIETRGRRIKAEELGVWDVDVFTDWTEGVFRAGVSGLGVFVDNDEDEYDDGDREASSRGGSEDHPTGCSEDSDARKEDIGNEEQDTFEN